MRRVTKVKHCCSIDPDVDRVECGRTASEGLVVDLGYWGTRPVQSRVTDCPRKGLRRIVVEFDHSPGIVNDWSFVRIPCHVLCGIGRDNAD